MSHSIMPDNPPFWRNERFGGSEEHHVFPGANRRLSDEDGLVIYLTPQQHRDMHSNQTDYWGYAKREAQKAFERTHGTRSDFVARYGRNYL